VFGQGKFSIANRLSGGIMLYSAVVRDTSR